jgi:osmotically-inducible protein OsmY
MRLPSADQFDMTASLEVEADPALAAVDRLHESTHQELHQIKCDFAAGVLTLHGQVSSYYLKQLAQSLVLPVDGVESCVNRLEVRPGVRLTW